MQERQRRTWPPRLRLAAAVSFILGAGIGARVTASPRKGKGQAKDSSKTGEKVRPPTQEEIEKALEVYLRKQRTF